MSFELHHPASVEEAIGLATRMQAARFIAGGTDLVIQMNRKKVAPAHLIDISRLPGLTGLRETAQEFTLGALTTYREIERHAALQGDLQALVEAARVVGGHQVRNIATVGGNVVNSSPAADFVPALLALDAQLDIAGPSGRRSMPLQDFLLGPGKVDLRSNEMLCAIRFARLPASSATAFLKEGRRKAMEISVVCMAARLTLDAAGRCAAVRLVVGAAAPTALRLQAAEQLLVGRPLDQDMLRAAGHLAAEVCTPISDVRASADHRRHLVGVLTERVLSRCIERINRIHA
jgi:aerobic carbon-monoxide dehydrogenase medium subunit